MSGVQIDFLLAEFQRRPRAAVTRFEHFGLHPQDIFVKPNCPAQIHHGQHKMIKLCQRWHLHTPLFRIKLAFMSDHTQTKTDVMDVARARALQATLGQTPSIEFGHQLPPFFHQIYFWDAQTPDRLGRDGHPATGGFIPDMGLPRRMWAAGKLIFHGQLLAGSKADRISVIEGMTRKDGRSGPLAFVRVRHDIRQRNALVLTEWQELVYRPDTPTAQPEPQMARTDETATTVMSYDATHLFRYSALTFNGHRIHYDVDYARDVEGYAGLVVHGPLHAHMLMSLAQEQLGQLGTFSYRATSPLIAGEDVTYCWNDGAVWARGPDGRLVMTGSAAA